MHKLMKIPVLFGFLILLPLILISMLFIYLEDGRPVIFFQDRLGKDKKKFKILKIRTMKKETPSVGTHEVSKENYLMFGTILRNTKIDELPQLFNYLKGDINLIGPRPGLPNQIELREQREKYNIFSVKPGISGLSQVLGFDMGNPKKLSKIDKIYLDNRNLKVDLYILFATFLKAYKLKLYKIFKSEIVNISGGKDV